MLQSLTIENYALIDHLEFNPTQGMTVITGETGAGKSIIMGALGLILGQRADAKAVRAGANKCTIEATFDIADYQLEPWFTDNELEYDAHATIIRREIYANGKSRAFINDSPTQLTILKTLGDALIDIHSQHQNLLIGKETFQQEVLDTLAANSAILKQYEEDYRSLCQLRKQLRKAKDEAEANTKEADYIRFQFNQLQEASLVDGEQEELEEELETLSHSEEIKLALSQISSLLDSDEMGILGSLKEATRKAQGVLSVYPALQEIAERLESDYIDLKDMCGDIDRHADRISFDPERYSFVEERLELIYDLEKKHGCQSVEELLALQSQFGQKLEHIDNSDEEIAELEAMVSKQLKATQKSAKALTTSRQQASVLFVKELTEKVAYLGMPNVRFEVQINPLSDFTSHGMDEIEFLFSANKNQPLKPCSEVASGGEISRIMLSIKALVASARTLPTIIFDEIDTGVSGDIADRMGQVMKQMSDHLQVITITHLPQVAGKGSAHFLVHKEDSETDTTTHISPLSGDDRIREVARMLSGATITDEALANARTLLA